MFDYSFLDDDQKAAVEAPDGVILVNAGAGTGKTTTLMARIANLIDSGAAKPSEIMAVTFTNKAAQEIRDRVSAVCEGAQSIRMGTFHSLSLRILRQYAEQTGLESSRFLIADEDDVKKLIELAVDTSGAFGEFQEPARGMVMTDHLHKELIAQEKSAYNTALSAFKRDCIKQINRWKECGLHVEQALEQVETEQSDIRAKMILVYEAYQNLLDQRNLCDFADLILRVVHLFDQNPKLALEGQSKAIKYLLVDEFQDVNMLQFRWIEHLTKYHGNLFAVGDIDQSLYSFRASAPQIMQRLSKMSSLNITLRNNRRCTRQILAPANKLVDINKREEPKVLKSEKSGDNVTFRSYANEFSEANAIAKAAKDLINNNVPAEEIAIIVRSKYILSPIEKSLLKARVPYTMVGTHSLLDREEVKDMLAFLKLAVDPYNDLAFSRIANKPTRGLGPTAVQSIIDRARANNMAIHETCFDICSDAERGIKGTGVQKKALAQLAEFAGALSDMTQACDMAVPPYNLLEMAYEVTGYIQYIEDADDGIFRGKNIKFLKYVARDFSDPVDFLQEISLLTDIQQEGEGVRLMSAHASKGLEFDHIFLPAWEEGVFPSSKSVKETPGDIDDPWQGPPIGGVEEERRIAHVALTRARKTAAVSCVSSRAHRKVKPSRFAYDADFLSSYRRSSSDEQYNSISFPASKPSPFKKKKPLHMTLRR